MRDRIRGCLLAGAVGDALGAPLEFVSGEEIRRHWGPLGPEGYVDREEPPGRITDDTQMTLFTAEGILRARARAALKGICHPPSVVRHAYLRWLHTQGDPAEHAPRDGAPRWPDGWLVTNGLLHARRAPGMTCLGSLRSGRQGTREEPLNHSKGCGAVMRMAPVGVLAAVGDDCFERGCEFGALTHGHPTGWIAAGVLAATVGSLLEGRPLRSALEEALARAREVPRHEETVAAVERAIAAAAEGPPSWKTVEALGKGWVAEEALAIAAYAALAAPDLRTGLRLAVAHGGDSDSTGAIAGNLLGALQGEGAIPRDLLDGLEGRDLIARVADDLHAYFVERRPRIEEAEWTRYPGW